MSRENETKNKIKIISGGIENPYTKALINTSEEAETQEVRYAIYIDENRTGKLDKFRFLAEFGTRNMAEEYVKMLYKAHRCDGRGLVIERRECRRHTVLRDHVVMEVLPSGQVVTKQDS